MKYQNAAVLLPLLAIAAGCTTTGMGYGSAPSGAIPCHSTGSVPMESREP